MSLRFYFGPSDGELSRQAYQEIIERSFTEEAKQFLVIVPDQFTMQTQKEMAVMHPRGGIMNIDVLSFGRLGHRVAEEVGSREIPVLDDTGKCLVLQKLAAAIREELPVLGGFLHRQGYIHEVKSAISEFMQYGIRPSDLDKMREFARDKNALQGKLADLQTIYTRFTEYIQDHFITAEETLDVLCRNLEKSKLVKDSVILLDGFTGFTPIQYRLIEKLMTLGEEVILTLVCGEEENPYVQNGEQNLFYLTKKTVRDLEKLAGEVSVERDRRQDIRLGPEGQRLRGGEREPGDDTTGKTDALENLRRNLFRYGRPSFAGEQRQIRILEATNPSEEAHQAALLIRELIRTQSCAYRDIVVITGDLEGYAPYIETEFGALGIPCFLDRTRGIRLNPLTEYIQSLLALYLKDFHYEAVFPFLRSGMTDVTPEEADRLENYVLETGIRGRKRYASLFTRKTRHMDERDEEELAAINATRQKLMDLTGVFPGKKKDLAKNYVDALYDFLFQSEVGRKLEERSKAFEEAGDLSRSREYAQIYRLVMELLNQIYQLLGEEEITLREFSDILQAGFGEIEVGMIPQNVDRVLVGDMERTRFKPVKNLLFLGVNDGNIPRNTSKGGILSDMEREFLQDSSFELAPTPRQQMFIQRFYLYLNLTKPTEHLILSYSRQGSDGKSVRKAYLIDDLRRMYPGLEVEIPQNREILEQIVTPVQGLSYLAAGLRDYAANHGDSEKTAGLLALYRAYEEIPEAERRDVYVRNAFSRLEDRTLPEEIAGLLYGTELGNSVSRLETYAECAYRHFLQYGLSLEERREFGLETTDVGTLYHDLLKTFSERLARDGKTWFDFEEDYVRGVVSEELGNQAGIYKNNVFEATHRNLYQITRMERILVRTILTLQKQIKKGAFAPGDYEVPFRQIFDLADKSTGFSGDEKMCLQGRIDRVDLAEQTDRILVKVLDYKSGETKLDLAELYYGLQLQLVVYMNAALELQRKKHPGKEVCPAALLYYHIADPLVEVDDGAGEEEIEHQVLKSLRTKGLVTLDEDIIELLDGEFTDKSDVIPVERTKSGFSANSGVMSREDLQLVMDFVNRKIQRIGREILVGHMEHNPYEMGDEEACTYCPYRGACGFDPKLPGCRTRKLTDAKDEEILAKMKEEL